MSGSDERQLRCHGPRNTQMARKRKKREKIATPANHSPANHSSAIHCLAIRSSSKHSPANATSPHLTDENPLVTAWAFVHPVVVPNRLREKSSLGAEAIEGSPSRSTPNSPSRNRTPPRGIGRTSPRKKCEHEHTRPLSRKNAELQEI